jgi:AAA ATPase domain
MPSTPRHAASIIPIREVQARLAVTEPRAVTIVSGGSGGGKTTVLDLVASFEGGVTPPVYRLARSDELDQVLLGQLAEALRQIATEENVEDVARRLRAAVASLAGKGIREVAATAAFGLLDALTAGAGSKVLDGLGPLRDEFADQGAPGAIARIEQVQRTSVLQVILEFAAATSELSGGQLVVLRIDEGQLLDEEGLRLLADLAERLPSGVRLVVAWSKEKEAAREALGRLLDEDCGCAEIELAPLNREQLKTWHPEAFSDEDPGRVLILTGGSPLVIDDAVRVGLPLSPADAVSELVERAMESLEEPVRDAARRLSVLARRPPAEELSALVAPLDWVQVESRLAAANLLASTGESLPWIHDLRRGAVLGTMDDAERAAAARRAYDILVGRAGVDDSWQPELLALAREARDTWEQGDPEHRLLDLGWDAISVLAAHLELASATDPAVTADPLLRYARTSWDASPEVEGSLEPLQAQRLIVFKGEGYPLRVRRTDRLDGVLALVCARCLERLGRRPVFDLAGSVVLWGAREALGTPVSRFARVGDADVHSLVRLAHAVSPDHPRDDPPATLIATLRFRQVSMALVASYATAAERDTAVAALSGLDAPLFGKQLEVRRVMPLPSGPTPSRRWQRALERVLGVERGGLDSNREGEETLPKEEALARKLATYELVWELANEAERAAMDLDRHLALAWTTQDDWFVELEIHGGREGITSTRLPPVFSGEPLSFFRLEEALRLDDSEKLIGPLGRTPPPGRDIPEIEALEQLDERAGGYDDTLPRLPVQVEPVALERLLTEALERELEIARELRARLPVAGERGPVSPLALVLLVPSSPDAEGWTVRGEPWCIYALSTAPRTSVTVRALDRIDSVFGDNSRRALEDTGLLPDANRVTHGWSQLHPCLAELLGYRPECIVMRWCS